MQRQFAHGHPLVHGGDDFVNQFAAQRPDTRAAQNFARDRIGQQFHKAVLRFHDQGFAVIVERMAGRR